MGCSKTYLMMISNPVRRVFIPVPKAIGLGFDEYAGMNLYGESSLGGFSSWRKVP